MDGRGAFGLRRPPHAARTEHGSVQARQHARQGVRIAAEQRRLGHAAPTHDRERAEGEVPALELVQVVGIGLELTRRPRAASRS